MKKKQINRIGFISSNALRQILVSAFSMVIPFLVIHYSSKEVWGSFVSILLFTLFALQIINWGNKEYLLREFSKYPSKINQNFSENMITRLPLVVCFSIVGFVIFPIYFGFWIMMWIIGRYFNHSVESLILYQKKFKSSLVIEFMSFALFGLFFFFLRSKVDVYLLLIIYSSYQFIKGFLYFVLFKKYLSFQKLIFNIGYFKVSFSFFLLSILGFLGSKIDVYITDYFGNKTITAEYQIINSLLVFTMSITSFIYAPFTKMIYRNNDNVMHKSKKTLTFLGLIIVPASLLVIYLILKYYLKTNFSIVFYLIAFIYVYPSYLFCLDIVNLFKQHKEKIVVLFLFIGVVLTAVLSSLFLYLDYGIIGVLLGSAIAQLTILILFKLTNKYVL